MANKNVNILLRLQDKFTKPLQGSTREIKAQKKQIKLATTAINEYAEKANKAFKKVSAVAGGATVGLGAAAIKTGFSEALDLEGYKMQLETATKDTQRASQIMQYAIDLANRTPFEGGQLVEGAAKFEALGLSAEKWLTYAGDMAAATNKDFDQSVEAIIDAQAGELERLKEFGITKRMILEQGEKMFAGVQIANNNGQIVNQEKFNEAMLALMEDKFAGGMEKQATTVKGLWSTVTGVTKNALANIVGMQNDGTIQAGSLLDLLKGKVSDLADRFQQWQQDGTIEDIGQKVAKAAQVAGVALEKGGNLLAWVQKNADWLIPVLTGVAGGFAAFNVLGTVIPLFGKLSGVMKGVTTAGGLLNAVMAANPALLIAAGIAVLITAGVALWKNWDKVKAAAQKLEDKVFRVFGNIHDKIVGAFEGVKTKAKPVIDWLQEKLDKLSSGFETATEILGSNSTMPLGQKALGTPYYAGGPTRINEGGRGEIVNLPNGTQIIPHDISQKMAEKSGPSIQVHVTVQGNVIGNRAFMEQTGEYIANKILAAQGVV